MKNIKKKFHLNITTYFFFLISFLCGYFKPVLIIFFIIFCHECGHILMIKFFHYAFLRVDFYPFGGITKIDKPINSSINQEIIIALAGVIVQIILQIIFFFFYHESNIYMMFSQYNFLLLCFNLLPIIPLDGSIIIHALLEKYFSYEKAYKIYEMISMFCLSLFLFFNIYLHFHNYFICIVLFWSFVLLKKQKLYLLKRFYLERYLYDFPYKTIKNHSILDISLLKKDTRHYFYDGEKYYSEKRILSKIFQE